MKLQTIFAAALLAGMPLLAQTPALRPVVAEEAISVSSATPANAANDPRASAASDDSNDVSAQQVPQTTTRAANTARTEIKRPKSEGSMVGYIDDAVPSTELRLRFDAGFNDPFPDRGEFFYGKCGCYRTAPAPVNDPKAPGPAPGIARNLNFQQLYLYGEYSPQRVPRFSAFFELPFRWIQPKFVENSGGTFPNHGGVSDVSLGLKFAALDTERSTVSLQLKAYLPSGDAIKGLGTNHSSVEPSLLLYHSLSSRWTLEGQLGGWIPINGSRGVPTAGSSSFAGSILIYGAGVSAQLYQNNAIRIAPVVELFGWHLLGGFQTQAEPAGPVLGVAARQDGTNIVNAKFGVRTTVHDHSSVYIGYGRAVTDAAWYKNLLRIEYRYVF
jgi:hypothetical protein